ncbi:MAG: lysophospholipid acyltransferase family protein [Candidatus Aminicenantes bacterium]|nr:lysophospholipid acyltransferase family protein [Candidatus Aminicenantes bacterium]
MRSHPTPKYFFLRKAAKFLINAIIKTCRIHITNQAHIRALRENNIPIIFTFWHRHIFFVIFRFKHSGARPLISHSRDGEIVSQIAEEFGMNPIRGSSSSGGARAFLKLLESLKTEKSDILITADGPRGPLREIKDGTILLALKTHSAIVPISWHSSRVKVFKKTWDRFMIPLPFSHITFSYGEPIILPPTEKGQNKEQHLTILKTELQERMVRLEQQTEAIYKK